MSVGKSLTENEQRLQNIILILEERVHQLEKQLEPVEPVEPVEFIPCTFTINHSEIDSENKVVNCELTNEDILKVVGIIGDRVGEELTDAVGSLKHMWDLDDNAHVDGV